MAEVHPIAPKKGCDAVLALVLSGIIRRWEKSLEPGLRWLEGWAVY